MSMLMERAPVKARRQPCSGSRDSAFQRCGGPSARCCRPMSGGGFEPSSPDELLRVKLLGARDILAADKGGTSDASRSRRSSTRRRVAGAREGDVQDQTARKTLSPA